MVFSAAGGLILVMLLWSVFLGMRINRPVSGSRDIHRGSYDIRGTVEDTKKELEKHIRDLYKEPMEITQSENTVSFIRVEPQPFLRSLKAPFEKISFTISEKDSESVRITHSTRLKRFRKNIRKIVIGFLILISIPITVLIAHCIAVYVMPAYTVQGDIIPSVRYTRRQIVHSIQIIHVIWPPLLFLLLHSTAVRSIIREYRRIFRNIEAVE